MTAFIIIVTLGVVLIVVYLKGFIKDDALQVGANISAIIALMAAIALFVFPAPTASENETRKASETPVSHLTPAITHTQSYPTSITDSQSTNTKTLTPTQSTYTLTPSPTFTVTPPPTASVVAAPTPQTEAAFVDLIFYRMALLQQGNMLSFNAPFTIPKKFNSPETQSDIYVKINNSFITDFGTGIYDKHHPERLYLISSLFTPESTIEVCVLYESNWHCSKTTEIPRPMPTPVPTRKPKPNPSPTPGKG